MSNNAPDYENDLVFPPQEIKSQHELSEQGRQSDVLIKAIEKCEKLEQETQQLKELLKECRTCLKVEYTFSASKTEEKILSDILDKINKAIGEE